MVRAQQKTTKGNASMKTQYLLRYGASGRYLVKAGTAGFRTTHDPKKATRFRDASEACRFREDAGVTAACVVEPWAAEVDKAMVRRALERAGYGAERVRGFFR